MEQAMFRIQYKGYPPARMSADELVTTNGEFPAVVAFLESAAVGEQFVDDQMGMQRTIERVE